MPVCQVFRLLNPSFLHYNADFTAIPLLLSKHSTKVEKNYLFQKRNLQLMTHFLFL